jgi:hypothetical protein
MESKAPTTQEQLMLEMLREWSGRDDARMVIEFRDGAWDITMSTAPHGVEHTARGTGTSFDEAWNNMDPTWA